MPDTTGLTRHAVEAGIFTFNLEPPHAGRNERFRETAFFIATLLGGLLAGQGAPDTAASTKPPGAGINVAHVTSIAARKLAAYDASCTNTNVVDLNPLTGAIVKKRTVQGKADESTWARGQTWAIYGFAYLYDALTL